jgi:hypothetical protein
MMRASVQALQGAPFMWVVQLLPLTCSVNSSTLTRMEPSGSSVLHSTMCSGPLPPPATSCCCAPDAEHLCSVTLTVLPDSISAVSQSLPEAACEVALAPHLQQRVEHSKARCSQQSHSHPVLQSDVHRRVCIISCGTAT